MCKIHSTILCPIWRLLSKKLLSEGTKRDGYKARSLRSWSALYGEHDSEIHRGQRAQGEHSQQPMESTTRITAYLCWKRPLGLCHDKFAAWQSWVEWKKVFGVFWSPGTSYSESGPNLEPRPHLLHQQQAKKSSGDLKTSTAGRRSSQQIEGASSQASGQGGVSEPPPTNQIRSVLQQKK